MTNRMMLGGSALVVGVVLVGCERVSFNYYEQKPRPDVTVIEHRPPEHVHVIEHRPVREVHVVEPRPVREVHVVQPAPVAEVHIHAASHVCTPGCGHYYDGAKFVVIQSGHRHGPGCGHSFNGKHWIIVASGKAKPVQSSPPPRKYKRP